MKALVYKGPGSKAWEEVPHPSLREDTDAMVGIDVTTICGSDLHILKGDTPEVTVGRILGHEAVGTIEEVGTGVKTLSAGDRVLRVVHLGLRSLSILPGRALRPMPRRGWLDPRPHDRRHPSEYVRVPFADTSTYRLPDGANDEELLMLADILPTAYEVGVLNGRVPARRHRCAVVESRPDRALSHHRGTAVLTESRDRHRPRGRPPGRSQTFWGRSHVQQLPRGCRRLRSAARRRAAGADVAIEAVGVPASFQLCTELVRPGGHVANIGVHGKPVTLHLESLWTARDVTITTGLVDTYSTPTLLRLVASTN